MIYDEFKNICRKPGDEAFNYLCSDECQKEGGKRFCFFNENKNKFSGMLPKTNSF